MSNTFEIYAIFDHPDDHPDEVIARQFSVYLCDDRQSGRDHLIDGPVVARGKSIRDVRGKLAVHSKVDFLPSNDPSIVETWI